ncbi:hypothetical protein TPR58_17865 [Sphingomonas sp. HF-S3]|uniref:SHOCT domain-containing protein n=1 Tax=Sphingomonas rustica TaxID=3103142 RepID=A0ABV0BBV2_9SPHN
MSDHISEELQRHADLRASGVLNENEFEAQKAKLLKGGKTSAKTGGGLRRVIIWGAIGLFVLILIPFLVGGGGDRAAVATGNGAAPAAAAGPEPIKITAKELAAAYEKNEAAAAKRFADQRLLVDGTIASVDKTFGDQIVLQLETGNFINAQANLKGDAMDAAASLNKGQAVKVLCESVDEMMSIPVLSDCALQ